MPRTLNHRPTEFPVTRSRINRLAALFGVLAAGAAAADTVTITSIGALLSTQPSGAYGVNANGTAVVGYSMTGAGMRAIRWTPAGGLQNLGLVPGGLRSQGFAISADGTTITGMSVISGGGHVFQWSVGGGMHDLGTLAVQNVSYGFAISADGQTIAGGPSSAGDGHALRWTAQTGMLDLGTIPGDSAAAIYGLSADGTDGTGYSRSAAGSRAIYWSLDDGMVSLGVLPGGTSSEGDAISADGSVVTGFSDGATGTHAFRWTAATGMQDLGTVPGRGSSFGLAISADGSAIAGNDESGAILWTRDGGMMDLRTYLIAHGANLAGWTLNYCYGISADGTALAGEGRFNGQTRGWIVRGLPSLCAPRITSDPASTSTCPFSPATFSVTAAGGTPAYQWQIEGTPGSWMTLGVDPTPLPCGGAAYASNPAASQTQIAITPCAGVYSYQVRCVVTNSCGAATSTAAMLTICVGEYNCDGGVDGGDVAAFFTDWEAGIASADVNQDGGVDGADVQTFFVNWEAGC